MTIETLPGMPVTVERDVPATMRDGTVLRADVYRPTGPAAEGYGDGVPVLLARSPYDKRINVSTFGNAHSAWYASHGYMVVIQDCRGRYTSEGDFYPFAHETDDGYDTVEWAARLDGANGDVGMFGFSYVGATQLLAAVARPPSLRSIAPGFTASQYYDGWTYNGGALATAFVCYWANLLALGSAVRAGDRAAVDALSASLGAAEGWFWSLPMAEFPPLQGGYAPYFYDWVEHCSYDDYWKRWSIDTDYSRIEVPALHFGGWWDVFLSGTVKNFTGLSAGAGTEAARKAQKLLVGPWTHMPWTPVGRCGGDGPSTNEIDDWQLRWFDHTLKGVDTGVLDSPATVFTLDGRMARPRRLAAFRRSPRALVHPLAGAGQLQVRGRHPRPGPGRGRAPRHLRIRPRRAHSEPGRPFMLLRHHHPHGPRDQHGAEVSRMILVYTSEPLAADIELLGDVSVTLHAATTATDTDFTARLCVVDPDGRSVNLQEGILRARYRNSLSDPEPLVPGEVYELRIDLGPVGAHVPAGSRLRLDISSSDFPQWDRNLNSGGTPLAESALVAAPATQTVLHNADHPTRITLPIYRAAV